MHRASLILIAATVAAMSPPIAARAQARIDNIYDGRDHEPAAGPTIADEKSAGVALPPQQARTENHELAVIQQHLDQRAAADAKAVPQATNNPYGVLPNGVVKITPDSAGAGGPAGSAAVR